MITLVLPSSLTSLMPDLLRADHVRPESVCLNAASWMELTDEIRTRFPRLADRVLTPSGTLTSGFVLVVNDVAVPARGREVDKVHDGDEIAIIPALAGG
jgi:molybdopterin converting factor small subunit